MRDISHPECEAQLEDVMTVLEKQLNIKAPLFDSMIEAQNKIDLWYASLTTDTVILSACPSLHVFPGNLGVDI